jgi:hypothetical protein
LLIGGRGLLLDTFLFSGCGLGCTMQLGIELFSELFSDGTNVLKVDIKVIEGLIDGVDKEIYLVDIGVLDDVIDPID